MNKYNNSIIYIIKCLDQNVKECYIGSTTNFNRRNSQHYYSCYSENSDRFNYKLYKCIRENGGWINWEMKELIKTSCNNKQELHKLEGLFIKKYDAELNYIIAGRTRKEWNTENKKEIKEKRKEYFKEYREKNKGKNKEYYIKNKEDIDRKNKDYYIKNKEYIDIKRKEWNSKKIECECGSITRRDNLNKHKKTKKHIEKIDYNKYK